jgi:hypothetical protein
MSWRVNLILRSACRSVLTLSLLAVPLASSLEAGGAWVPDPGHGGLYLGASRKTAHTSWDVNGDRFDNISAATGEFAEHDFRYGYLSGEVGVLKNASVTFTLTYLHGLEGPKSALEKNTGLSEAWIGAKYQLVHGNWPMALSFNHRNPFFYDLDGSYNRHIFDNRGQFRGVSPEWRGMLKEDYTLSYLASKSFAGYRAWANAELGYTWRTGAPSDHWFLTGEVGYPLPILHAKVKGGGLYVKSRGNFSPREPDDRFGNGETFNFNDASMLRGTASVLVPIAKTGWSLDLGYGHWLWGHSARRYREPYLSIGRGF